MQQEIREKHAQAMGDSHSSFMQLKEAGKLLKPEQPGHVIAKLALNGGKELSGQFLKYVPYSLLENLSTNTETAGTRSNWLPFKNEIHKAEQVVRMRAKLHIKLDIIYPLVVFC